MELMAELLRQHQVDTLLLDTLRHMSLQQLIGQLFRHQNPIRIQDFEGIDSLNLVALALVQYLYGTSPHTFHFYFQHDV